MAFDLKLARRALSRDSYAYAVIRRVVDAVGQGLGKPTRWTGEVQLTKDGLIEAAAHPDGRLTVNQSSVVAVLERADRDRAKGKTVDPVELRTAVDTLVHAAIDLCTASDNNPAGRAPRGTTASDNGASIAFNEGVTRLLTDSVLDDVIRQIGLDLTFPEILQVQSRPSYSVFAAAARPVIRELSRETGMHPRQVLTQIATAGLEQKFAAVSAMMAQAQPVGALR